MDNYYGMEGVVLVCSKSCSLMRSGSFHCSIFDLSTQLYPAYFLPLASLGNLAKVKLLNIGYKNMINEIEQVHVISFYEVQKIVKSMSRNVVLFSIFSISAGSR